MHVPYMKYYGKKKEEKKVCNLRLGAFNLRSGSPFPSEKFEGEARQWERPSFLSLLSFFFRWAGGGGGPDRRLNSVH